MSDEKRRTAEDVVIRNVPVEFDESEIPDNAWCYLAQVRNEYDTLVDGRTVYLEVTPEQAMKVVKRLPFERSPAFDHYTFHGEHVRLILRHEEPPRWFQTLQECEDWIADHPIGGALMPVKALIIVPGYPERYTDDDKGDT